MSYKHILYINMYFKLLDSYNNVDSNACCMYMYKFMGENLKTVLLNVFCITGSKVYK